MPKAVGIDLGTTNSVVSFLEAGETRAEISSGPREHGQSACR